VLDYIAKECDKLKCASARAFKGISDGASTATTTFSEYLSRSSSYLPSIDKIDKRRGEIIDTNKTFIK